jgi:hypothetical protein
MGPHSKTQDSRFIASDCFTDSLQSQRFQRTGIVLFGVDPLNSTFQGCKVIVLLGQFLVQCLHMTTKTVRPSCRYRRKESCLPALHLPALAPAGHLQHDETVLDPSCRHRTFLQ